MSFYTKVKIVLTIILSVIVSFITYTYLRNLKENTTVVIANQDIEAHTVIKPEMVQEVEINKRDREIFEKDAVTNIQEIENAVSNIKISKGKTIIKNNDVITGTKEELTEKKVLLEDGQINDAYFLSDNKRITTVKLDSEGAVGDKLKIGDYVDVIFSQVGEENKSFSISIMQHIEIYDIKSDENAIGDKNVSLVVTPQQAVDITYAKREGKVDLAIDSSKGEDEEVYPSNINKFLKMSSS